MVRERQDCLQQCNEFQQNIMILMEKDCQKRRQPSSTDSVIARLMGFDELFPQQPLRKQQRVLSDSYIRNTASIGLRQGSSVCIGRSRDTNNNVLLGVKGVSGVQIYKDKIDFIIDKHAHSSTDKVKMVVRSQKPAVASISQSTSGAIYENNPFNKKDEHHATGYILRSHQKLESDTYAAHVHDLNIDYTNNFLEFRLGTIDKPCFPSTGVNAFKPKSEKVTNNIGDIKLGLLSESEHRSSRPESGKLYHELRYKELFNNDTAHHRIMNGISRQERRGIISKDLSTLGHTGENYLVKEPEAMVSSCYDVYDYKDYNHPPRLFLNQSSLAEETKTKNLDRCKIAKETNEVEVSGRDQIHGKKFALADMESMPKYLNLRLGINGLGTLPSMQHRNSGTISPSGISRIQVRENDHIRTPRISETLLPVCNLKQDETTRRYSRLDEEERSPQEILEPKCGSSCEQISYLGVNCVRLENNNPKADARAVQDETENILENDRHTEIELSPGVLKSLNLPFRHRIDDTLFDAAAFKRVVSSGITSDQQSELDHSILSMTDAYSSNVHEFFSGKASLNEFSDEESGYSNCSSIGSSELQRGLKGINDCSPDSVLEPFDRQNPSPFEHFESIGEQLQLQVLNSESDVAYSEGSEMVVSGDEDLEEGFDDPSHDDIKVRRWSGDYESRSFSYLVDVLDEAGFCGEKPITDFKSWHSLECPISPLVFEGLEKKYGRQTSWQKSERQLLFDRINSGLIGIFYPLINFHVRPTSITRWFVSKLKRDEVEDELWMMLIGQEREKNRGMSEKGLEGAMKWLEFDDDINIICTELETSIFYELVIESMGLWN